MLHLFLGLAPRLISQLSLLLFSIGLNASLHILFEFPALSRWELVQLELEDLSVALVYAFSDDLNYSSLLLGGQLVNVLFQHSFLIHGHLLVADGHIGHLIDHSLDLTLTPPVIRKQLISGGIGVRHPRVSWLHRLALHATFAGFLLVISVVKLLRRHPVSHCWHRGFNKRLIGQLSEDLLEILLDLLCFGELCGVVRVDFVAVVPHLSDIVAQLEGSRIFSLSEAELNGVQINEVLAQFHEFRMRRVEGFDKEVGTRVA